LPVVFGDAIMLHIVLSNLISNALKFSRQRPNAIKAIIEIGCKQASDAVVEIFVRDNGIGFDMNYADKFFG
jgi:signal transduction histidine kinase